MVGSLLEKLRIESDGATKCKSLDGFPVIGHSSLKDATFVVIESIQINNMKKYICILAGTALLVACERKTETAAPSPTVSPEATVATSPEESSTATSPAPSATP